MTHVELDIAADHGLRKRFRATHEEPVKPCGGEVSIDVLEGRVHGNGIEHNHPFDTVGMVENHAMRHARAAVVSDEKEAVETQARHQLHLVLGQRTLGVADVFLARGRLFRIAVTAQV